MARFRVPLLLFTLSVLFLSCSSLAQSMPGMDHSHNKAKTVTVKGADRPDLISDDEAYRIVFSVVADHPQLLGKASLDHEDSKAALRIIRDYQKSFKAMLDAQTKDTVQKQFMLNANDLLKRTRSQLADHMSADGYFSLQEFVTNEKKYMTTTTVSE